MAAKLAIHFAKTKNLNKELINYNNSSSNRTRRSRQMQMVLKDLKTNLRQGLRRYAAQLLIKTTSQKLHAKLVTLTYSDDGSVVAYFDPDRIKRNGTGDMSPVAWILVNYNKPQKDKTTGGKSYQSVLRKTMYDCKYEKTAYLQAVWCAQKFAHGDVIDSVESNDYAWDSIVPNSMGEDELRFICKQ